MIEYNLAYTTKLFMLGNYAVGKTSFVNKYVNDKFREIYLPTIGFDYSSKTITLPNKKNLKICFHDSAGQERYRSIAFNLIKSAEGAILMYDITNKKTFEAIPEWIKNVREHKGEDFPIVLIGNKLDLKEKRVVKTEEGEELAKKYGFFFFETSSKTGDNVQECILELVLKIFEQKKKEGKIQVEKEIGKGEKSEKKVKKVIKLKKDKNPRKKWKCKC